jgi:hypothetical protein
MPDETKKYLINIESNLKKYAEEAAEAKKRVDELKAANDLLKQSGTASAAEIQANESALRNANKEYAQAKKLVDLQTAANSSNINSRKQLGEILQLEMQRLGKVGDAMIKNKDGVLVMNKAYVEQQQKIANTKQAILDYDKALNDGRSNIGRYGEAIEGAFKDAGTRILSMVGPMALVTAAIGVATKLFEGMKEALMSTTFAIDTMNKAGAVSKQLFYDLAINGELNIKNLISASKYQGELNKLRVEEGFDQLRISEINREEQAVRELSISRLKTHAERLVYLTQVKDLEGQKTKIEVEHLTSELAAKEKLLKQQPANEKLMLNVLDIRKRINDAYANEDAAMRRIETQRTGFLQEEVDKRKKMTEAWYKEIDDQNTENATKAKKVKDDSKKVEDDFNKYASDSDKKRRSEREKAGVEEINRLNKEYQDKLKLEEDYQKALKADQDAGFEYQRLKAEGNLVTLEKILDQEYGALLASDEYNKASKNEQLLMDEQYTQAKKEFSELRIDQTIREADIIAGLFGSMSNVIGKQTALGKTFAVAQSIMDTYAGATAALADKAIPSTALRFVAAASVILNGLANIRQILAVKIPGGSSSASMPTSITSSAPAQKVTVAPVGSTILNQPQLSQSQLNAIPNQNLLTAQDIANALRNLPAPIVTVEDINARQKSVQKVSVRANI